MPNDTILYLGQDNQLMRQLLEEHEIVIMPKTLNEKLVLKKYFKKDNEIESEVIEDMSELANSRLIIDDKEFREMKLANQIIDAIVNGESLIPYSKDEIFREIQQIIDDYKFDRQATQTENKAELRKLVISRLGYRRILGDRVSEVIDMYLQENSQENKNVLFLKEVGAKGATKPEEVNKSNSDREFEEVLLHGMGFGTYHPTIEYSDVETAATKVETAIKLNELMEKSNSGNDNIRAAKMLFLLLKSFYDLDKNNATVKHSLRVGLMYSELLKELEAMENSPIEKKHHFQLMLAAMGHDCGKLINLSDNGKNTFSAELQIHAGDRNKLDYTADAPIDLHASIGEANAEWITRRTGKNSVFLNYLKALTGEHHKNVDQASVPAQAVCVVDIFDALISKRNYGKNADGSDRTVEQAMAILVANTKGCISVKSEDKDINMKDLFAGKWDLINADFSVKENWENSYKNNILYKRLLIVNPELAETLKDQIASSQETVDITLDFIEGKLTSDEMKLLKYLEIGSFDSLDSTLTKNDEPQEVRNEAQANYRLLNYIEKIKNDRNINPEAKEEKLIELMKDNNEPKELQDKAIIVFGNYGNSIEETIPKVNPDILKSFSKVVQREMEKTKGKWLIFDKKNPHVVASVFGIDFTTKDKKRKIDIELIVESVKSLIRNLLDIDFQKINVKEVVKHFFGPFVNFVKEFLNESKEKILSRDKSKEEVSLGNGSQEH